MFQALFKTNLKTIPTYPKLSQKVPNTFPSMSQQSAGRARNRTRYPPDPPPGPVRGPAHWDNLVTRKKVFGDILCIKIRERGANKSTRGRKNAPKVISQQEIYSNFTENAGPYLAFKFARGTPLPVLGEPSDANHLTSPSSN